jgi:hypothetical protein
MPTLARVGFSLLLAAGFLEVQGCVLPDFHVTQPPFEEMNQLSKLGRGREVFLVMPFKDARPFPKRCGMRKGTFEMDLGDVVCAVPAPMWMAQVLSHGLSTAGFRVNGNWATQRPESVRIDATLLQFFIEPHVGFLTFSPEADISVKLTVTSQSGLLAERTFYFKAEETSFTAREGNYQAAVSTATKKSVAVLVRAIADLLDRYPKLGTSAAVSMLVQKEFSR